VPAAEEGVDLGQGDAGVAQVGTQQLLPDLLHPIVVILLAERQAGRAVGRVELVEHFLLLQGRHPLELEVGGGVGVGLGALLSADGHEAAQEVHVVGRQHQHGHVRLQTVNPANGNRNYAHKTENRMRLTK
jgi:hypothetical protein